MYPIVFAQWMKERRSPYLLFVFIGLSVLAVLVFGMNVGSKVEIDAFRSDGVSEAEAASWVERMNEGGPYRFELRDERPAMKELREGRSTVAVRLMKDDFRIVASVDDEQARLIERHVLSVYLEELRLREAASLTADPALFRERAEESLLRPPLTLQVAAPDGNSIRTYDMGLQLMYAFALFLVMFTIGFKINGVNAEKASGIWNRMILSPVRKTHMYVGHLSYTAAIGFLQVGVVLTIFRYGLGFDLGGSYGALLLVLATYIVAAVAMAMLFAGATRTPEQFNRIYPSVIPVIPLVSGAYMPPGTITNVVLNSVAELLPLNHAMDAFLGIASHGYGWGELFMPLAKMALLAVLFMGVGINLVERGRR
ncbi:ABC transporter permease [Paenibacillus sp. TRM 82003]|nr:ABC transporter permease [Paenibacillus sp. TRM 82003]